MIRVMIAEDCVEQNSACCRFLTKDKDIEIVSRVLDGNATLTEYLKIKPDVLILDLGLPFRNGLEIIDDLSMDLSEKKKCNIIITSSSFEMMHMLQNTSKVYRVMPKPCDYNHLLDTIKEIGYSSEEISVNDIRILLNNLKFNIYSNGFKYVAEAITIAYNDTRLLYNMNNLYKKVAFNNKENKNKIQRSIRSSIDVMNSHISKDLLRSFFHIYDNDIVTPKIFFNMVVEYFKTEHR